MKIKKSDLISTYAQSMGIETAKELINKKINAAALEEKKHYTEEETAKICGELIKEGGLIRIVAQTLLVQLEREKSEEQALLLDNIETQIWYLTDIETYGAVNKAHAEFLGMEKGNLEGESLYDIVGREEAGVCIAGNREVFEKKKQTRTEEWVKNGKEKKRLLSITRTPKIDDNGNVEYVICVAEDITERKQAEEVLRESEQKYRELIENLNEAVFRLSVPDGKYDYISPAIKDSFGYTQEDFLNTPMFIAKITHPDFIDDLRQNWADIMKGKVLPTYEYKIIDSEGNERWILQSNRGVFDDKGNTIAIEGICRDITECKQAEEKIKEYSENLERMVEERTRELKRALYDTEESRDRIDGTLKSIGDGLIVTDIYNRIILMNRVAEDLLGVRFSEVIDRPIDFAIKDETLRQRFKTSLEEREPGYQFDFELPGENSKHPKIIRARTSEIKDKTGKQTGIITIIYDVTLEREVDRMKTEFFSTASHQLRAPLTSILGFSEILMTRDNIEKEQQKEFLSHINTQSINLANIINDLLDISRIESGIGFTLHKVSCNINEIIRETVKHFQASHPKRQFDVILPKEPVELMVDKDKIGQVLENILNNAVQYSPEGGSICLTAKKIADFGFRISELEGHKKESAIRNPQSAIEISVADQGMGMSPDQVEKIFDKFYRADVSDRAIPGTGLGMSIVKNYVEAHGGKVWVESELGKGTVVTFVIPT